MKVLILEACRRPDIDKGLTESLVLSRFFDEEGIDFELFSNDAIWENKVVLDETLIRSRLKEPSIEIVHLAVHGGAQGFVLEWSNSLLVGDRIPLRLLESSTIALRSHVKTLKDCKCNEGIKLLVLSQ